MPIVIVLVALAAAGWLGFMAAAGGQYAMIMLAASCLAALFAFFSPKLSLALLVFSMLLSPEIGLGSVSGSRSLVVRYDDIFLVVIFMSWFARTAIFKHKPFIISTPVQAPVLVYTAICVISTTLGVLRGDISWKVSVFYVLKYVEYFLLFFMTVNIVDSKEDMKKLLRYGLVVAVVVTVYAYFYYYSSGITARATAPFEASIGNPKESEPASLGGYYLIVFSVLFGLISEGAASQSLLALAFLAFAFPAFLFTYSRASYIGFAVMLPAMLYFSKRRRLLLLGFLGAGALAFAFTPAIKAKVMERINMTYRGAYATQAFDTFAGRQIRLEDSAAARIYSLKRTLFEKLPKHPLLGWGVTGIGIGDTQYALLLGEIGLLGFLAFFWMVYKIFITSLAVYKAYDDPPIKALALGLAVSLLGLLAQAVGVNTFIIVRIMEPFWFMTALVMRLYLMRAEELRPAPRDGRAEGGS